MLFLIPVYSIGILLGGILAGVIFCIYPEKAVEKLALVLISHLICDLRYVCFSSA